MVESSKNIKLIALSRIAPDPGNDEILRSIRRVAPRSRTQQDSRISWNCRSVR